MNTQYKEILKQYWGYEDFRGIQKEIIESIGQGRDTLGLMPTGGGKSITFQVPSLAQEGICIVITPLIALMKDQVTALRNKGIKATAVYSGMTHAEIVVALENCILGGYKFLYISPERIGSELFQTKLRHMKVNFITVDEAHCISQWGYDFRPSYLQVAEIRKIVPNAPVLALTASATPEVVEDIMRQLHFGKSNVLRMSFERKNLTYIVRHTDDKEKEMLHILNNLPGSAIIYTRNRMQTQELAERIVAEGITATNYHAGLPQVTKDERQDGWQTGRYRVMVATNAFGMGIDKADVRLVMHYEVPDSPEAYFQEAGRAGRDGVQAYAILLYNGKDCTKLTRRVGETFPEPEYIRSVYEDMCCYLTMAMGDGSGVTREFDLQDFCVKYHHFPVRAHSALTLLSKTGIIQYTEDEEITSRLMFTLNRDELYRLRERPAQEEAIIQTMLRRYNGLFIEYVYIDENLIAKLCGLSVNEIYLTLKQMDHVGIVSYIPRKRTNYITFTIRRIEQDEIVLPPEVYADRRDEYGKRISAMIDYVTQDEICRSQYLLRYFGEDNHHTCGKCDVCTQGQETSPTTEEKIRNAILQQLKDGPLVANKVDSKDFDKRQFYAILRRMSQQEEIILDEEQRLTINPNI